MRVTKDELDPPFEILEPAKWRGPKAKANAATAPQA